jgi:cytochrome P450
MTTPATSEFYEPSKTIRAVDMPAEVPKENRSLDHIPGDYGPPIIGNGIRAVLDNLGMNREMYAKYGPVVKSSSMGQRYVTLLSPDAVAYVLLDKGNNFSSRLGWAGTIGGIFHGGLMLLDFEIHHAHRQLMQTAFRTAALQEYLTKLSAQMKNVILGWGDRSPLLLYPAIKKMTLTTAGSTFLGVDADSELEALLPTLVDLVSGATALVKRSIPGNAHWRGVRARRTLEAFLRKRIPDRRRAQGTDIFSRLCQAASSDGAKLTDDEIVNHMVFLMVAGHDTTASSLTMMAYELARHPEWQEQCRQEMQGLGPSGPTYDELKRFEKTEWVFKEAVRLYPPIPVIPRRVMREREFGGYKIPANATVILNVGFIQRMPEWWDEPDKFDPLRFGPARAEHLRHPYSWFPFGGGAHLCSGMHLALVEVKLFFALLLKNYELRLKDGYRMKYRPLPMPRPVDNLPMELIRR